MAELMTAAPGYDLAMPTRQRTSSTPGAGKATREAVILRARQTFLSSQRLDMQVLATELGIGRMTLYRWVGGRDNLIAEAIWTFTEPFLEHLRATTPQRGRDRLLCILEQLGKQLLELEPYLAFLSREPAAALRILTTPATFLQERMVEFVGSILEEESTAGRLRLPEIVDQDTLAYAIIRLTESFFYADMVAGHKADIDQAISVIALLLPGDTASTNRRT